MLFVSYQNVQTNFIMIIKYQPSTGRLGMLNYLLNAKLGRLFLLTGLVFLWSCGSETIPEEDTTDNTVTEQNEQGFARLAPNRPFSFADEQEGETFVIEDPSQASSWTTQSGTVLTVPANTILDPQGNLATEPITIRYREFREVAQIISSGIPMTVKQEDGSEEWMQTAGMFEIRGFQDGQAVAMAEGKSIKVDFMSPVDGEYDAWVLDDETQEWTNLGPGASPVEVPSLKNPDSTIEQEIAELKEKTATAPEKPVYEKQNEIRIDDPANLNQFPELRDKKSHLFVYAGKDASKAPKNNTWIRDKDWSRYELAAGPQSDSYELTLLAEDTTFTMLVKKALQPKDLAAAKAHYEALMADYKANLVTLRDKEAVYSQQRSYLRTIQAQGFRVHNYDILWKSSNSIPLMADFQFEDMPDALKDAVTVYFVTKNNQVIVGLPKSNWNAFRFDPNLDNKLIAVLPDNKVALFKQSDFKAKEKELLSARKGKYTFEMEVQETPVLQLNDLNQVIQMASL